MSREGGQWWDGDNPSSVYQVVQGLGEDRTSRRSSILSALRLYGDCPIAGWGGTQYTRSALPDEPLSYNVVRSVADTIHAEITQSRPRPMFLTSGGDFEVRQRAEKLSKFSDGVYYAARGDRHTSLSALDGILTGSGFVKVFDEFDKVVVERTFPGEIFVDERDARNGDPRCLYQIKHVDRGRMMRRFPKASEDIEHSSCGSDWIPIGTGGSLSTADMIEVVEAWHLPSGPGADDGRHVIAVSGGVVLDEGWESENFPFAKLDWTEALLGYFGAGVAEQLTGIQFEINRLIEDIRKAQQLMGNFKIFVEKGSKVVASHLTNEDGVIVEYSGTPPTFATFQAVHPEVYQQLERLYQKAFELVGVSAMNARAEKPAGLDSGRAIRAFSDIQSKRFLAFGRRWEEFHLDIARLSVECARRIAERVPDFDIVYQGRDAMERIAWSDVDLEEDAYVMRCFPTSMLPNTPAGKLATLQDLFNAQLIDQDGFLELADFPDLEAARKRKTAGRDVIEKRIEKILAEGIYLPPEGFFDLQRCFDQGVLAYCQGQLDGVPEERLEMLRDFIYEAQELLAARQPPPPPPPGDPMALPPPAPMDPTALPPPMLPEAA